MPALLSMTSNQSVNNRRGTFAELYISCVVSMLSVLAPSEALVLFACFSIRHSREDTVYTTYRFGRLNDGFQSLMPVGTLPKRVCLLSESARDHVCSCRTLILLPPPAKNQGWHCTISELLQCNIALTLIYSLERPSAKNRPMLQRMLPFQVS